MTKKMLKNLKNATYALSKNGEELCAFFREGGKYLYYRIHPDEMTPDQEKIYLSLSKRKRKQV